MSSENISDTSEEILEGKYTRDSLIGKGGAAYVFLAYDSSIGRDVAIKELFVDDAVDEGLKERKLKRFLREAKLTGQLEHPSVVPIYDMGTDSSGKKFYVMKYVRGKTLFQAVQDCEAKTPEESYRNRLKLLGNLIDVCDAMAYAHSKGVIHRDLKPGNIVLGEFGETIILDWGLAKKESDKDYVGDSSDSTDHDTEAEGEDITAHGALLGTPSYMAPEQADSRFGTVDLQSDVYSLGALLFYILTNQRIYEPGGKGSLKYLTNDEETPRLIDRNPLVSPELSAICSKATEKIKEKRFKDAGEMARELKAYRDGRLVSIYAYTRKELLKRFVAKNKFAVISLAALIITIIAGAAFSINFAYEAQVARVQAENALVDISSISQEGMKLVRGSVKRLQDAYEKLTEDMEKASDELHDVDSAGKKRINSILTDLHQSYPNIDGFAIIRSRDLDVNAVFPNNYRAKLVSVLSENEDFKSSCRTFENGMGSALMVDGRYTLPYIVPLGSNDEYVLAAFLVVRDFIPLSFDFDPLKSQFQVWCMQDDGRILYDEDSAQIGKFLFSDSMYQKFPELLQLGERMQKEPWGMGYYSFYERVGEGIMYKVAVWDALDVKGHHTFKIVVSHPYAVRKKLFSINRR